MASATSEIAKVSWLREAQHEIGPGLPGDRAEYFVTRILPGLKEGHEVLTRRAAAAVPGVDTRALLRGVVRVDAGKHIWNLPAPLASSLDPSQQRRHAPCARAMPEHWGSRGRDAGAPRLLARPRSHGGILRKPSRWRANFCTCFRIRTHWRMC